MDSEGAPSVTELPSDTQNNANETVTTASGTKMNGYNLVQQMTVHILETEIVLQPIQTTEGIPYKYIFNTKAKVPLKRIRM